MKSRKTESKNIPIVVALDIQINIEKKLSLKGFLYKENLPKVYRTGHSFKIEYTHIHYIKYLLSKINTIHPNNLIDKFSIPKSNQRSFSIN